MQSEIEGVIEGQKDIASLIGLIEGYELEFKQKDRAKAVLTRTDKKNLGAALSGLSNSGGGYFILGIETEKRDGHDTAVSLSAIPNAEALTAEIQALIGQLLRPENPNIAVYCLGLEGPICIRVGKSERRPHMSVAPEAHRYYRRGYDNTRMMDHNEIRDMMLAPKVANLEIAFSIEPKSSSSSDGMKTSDVHLNCHVINASNSAARAPFVLVKFGRPQLSVHCARKFTEKRKHLNGDEMIFSIDEKLIYPGDQHLMFGFSLAVGYDLADIPSGQWVADARKKAYPNRWKFASATALLRERPIDDLGLELHWGALNASSKSDMFQLSKSDLMDYAEKGNVWGL